MRTAIIGKSIMESRRQGLARCRKNQALAHLNQAGGAVTLWIQHAVRKRSFRRRAPERYFFKRSVGEALLRL